MINSLQSLFAVVPDPRELLPMLAALRVYLYCYSRKIISKVAYRSEGR